MIEDSSTVVPVVNYTLETWSKIATVQLEKQASANERSAGDRNDEIDAEEPFEASEEGPESITIEPSADYLESDRESTVESVELVLQLSSLLLESFFYQRKAKEEDNDSTLTDIEEVLVLPTPIIKPQTL